MSVPVNRLTTYTIIFSKGSYSTGRIAKIGLTLLFHSFVLSFCCLCICIICMSYLCLSLQMLFYILISYY